MKRLPAMADDLLLVAERLARQIYWSSPRLRSWVKWRRGHARPAPQAVDREELKRHLREIGVKEGALVMAHTSVTGLQLTAATEPDAAAPGFLAVANQLVDDLLALLGKTGTLVMPTHPRYQSDDEYGLNADPQHVCTYDPAKTPCGVGLANELFWRRAGVKRSLHPYNTLAACGPLADELLRDNLNDSKPLPHGIHSGYYRFCRHNGLVISIGVPLRQCLTLIHVAEEVRDQQWPIKDFFEEKRYNVRIDGHEQPFVVRQHRLEYGMYCLCLRKATRDLVRENILHEGMAGSVRVDWARAGDLFQHFMARNVSAPYPYYATWLLRKVKR